MSNNILIFFCIIFVLSNPKVGLAQTTFNIKYFGMTVHPYGDRQAFNMPYKIDKKGVFVPNFGGIIAAERFILSDDLSIKFAQGVYADCGAMFAGHTHLGFRYYFWHFGKDKHNTLSIGWGPTYIYRKSWAIKPGYNDYRLFKTTRSWQHVFVWIGGEIEYNQIISNNIDLSINLVPGYPRFISIGVGIRYWFKKRDFKKGFHF